MKVEAILLEQPKVNQIWRLVSQVAKDNIGFPTFALKYFSKKFTENEFSPLVFNDQIPTLIVQQHNKIIGVLIGAAGEGGVGSIIWLVVEPHHHGKGTGKALFNEACAIFRAHRCHKIKLTAPSIKAVSFYEKMGMTVEGFHPNHWWGMDFWTLGKKLT